MRVQIGEEILGKENAKRFLPMLTTIFLTILAFNLTGVIPGLNLAGTSRIGVPLLLALWVFVTYWAGASASTVWAGTSRRTCSRRACRGRSTSS